MWICAAMRPAQAAPQSCAGAPRAVLRTQTLRLEIFQSAAQGIVLRPSERCYATHGHQVLSYTSLQHPRKLQTTIFNFPSLMFPIPKRDMPRPMGFLMCRCSVTMSFLHLFTEQLQMDLKHARKITKHDEDAAG